MHLRVTELMLISTVFCESTGSLAVLGIEGKRQVERFIFVTVETMKWNLIVSQRDFISCLSQEVETD